MTFVLKGEMHLLSQKSDDHENVLVLAFGRREDRPENIWVLSFGLKTIHTIVRSGKEVAFTGQEQPAPVANGPDHWVITMFLADDEAAVRLEEKLRSLKPQVLFQGDDGLSGIVARGGQPGKLPFLLPSRCCGSSLNPLTEKTMQHDQRQLFEIARDFPWYHFTAEQISILCNVGEHKVRLARNAKDTPFRLNLCRPEQFAAWMLAHPEYQDLKSAPVDLTESAEACAASVKQTLGSRVAQATKKTRRTRQKQVPVQRSR